MLKKTHNLCFKQLTGLDAKRGTLQFCNKGINNIFRLFYIIIGSKNFVMKRLIFTTALFVLIITGVQSQVSDDRLSTFLVDAKIETYASGDESKIIECGEGCKEINYSLGGFKYRDRYYGEYNFSGEEIVWWKDKVIWSMNYFGITSDSEGVPDQFPEFLKEALRNVRKEQPFRGPEYYKREKYEYINEVEGDLADFRGVEKILYEGREIYRLYYHGGKIIF